MTKQATPRRHRRRPVTLAASLRSGDGGARDAEVSELSEAGCRVRVATGAPDPAQRVVVSPDALESLPAVVRWSDGAVAGVAFDGQLHPAIVDHLAGEGEVLGGPPRRRGDSAFTDRFGRALPSLSGGRRKP